MVGNTFKWLYRRVVPSLLVMTCVMSGDQPAFSHDAAATRAVSNPQVFKTVPTTSVSRTVVIVHSGQTMTMEIMFSDYSLNRAQDGSLTWTATGSLANGTAPTWS